jgi:predicted nucleotidyltransferase component of viral defense system
MNLFDRTVDAALEANSAYAALRFVVEKEILHYDILREMHQAGCLNALTFIGGTCLRKCYNSERLSEDLDFSGGFSFTPEKLAGIGTILQTSLQEKYGFAVSVSEPQKEKGNTDTWTIKMTTRHERPDVLAQKINIDICRLPSYERRPMMIKNQYGIEAGTSGLILYAESLAEILADKLIAFALRPNQIKNRDLWDIVWLYRRNITLDEKLLEQKLSGRKIDIADFRRIYSLRITEIQDKQQDFLSEMRRFLSPAALTKDLAEPVWWNCLRGILEGFAV